MMRFIFSAGLAGAGGAGADAGIAGLAGAGGAGADAGLCAIAAPMLIVAISTFAGSFIIVTSLITFGE
jgi:hypothetical protein